MAATALCPKCRTANQVIGEMVDGEVWVDLRGTSKDKIDGTYWLHKENPGVERLALLKCGRCSLNYVAYWDFHDQHGETLWPLLVPSVPDAVPDRVAEAFRDALIAQAAGSKIGALMAGRATLERMLRDKGASGYKEMVEKGIITHALYGVADQLRLWASVAGHTSIPLENFSPEEVQLVLDYLRTVLEAAYSHQAAADRFVAKTKALKAQGK
jgi:hypothetical protein